MLTDIIPYGRENAVSRAYVARMSGLTDREIRNQIKRENEVLAESGCAVVSSASQKGYWKTDDPNEMEAYIHEQMHRAMKIIENLHPVRQLVKEKQSADQMKMEE